MNIQNMTMERNKDNTYKLNIIIDDQTRIEVPRIDVVFNNLYGFPLPSAYYLLNDVEDDTIFNYAEIKTNTKD